MMHVKSHKIVLELKIEPSVVVSLCGGMLLNGCVVLECSERRLYGGQICQVQDHLTAISLVKRLDSEGFVLKMTN